MTGPVPRVVAAAVLAGLVAVSTLAACSGDSGPSDSSTSSGPSTGPDAGTVEVLAALTDGVIVPGYTRLTETLGGWASAQAALCATPGPDQLDGARQLWRESLTAYATTTPVAVGPAMELRLMSDLAFAHRASSIDSLIAGTDPLDIEAMAEQGAAVRGLYAAEYALFSPAAAELTGPAGARRCRYLESVSSLASDAARAVSDAWTTGDAREAFLAATGSAPDDAVPQLLNAVTHAVKDVDEKGLRDMAAAATYEELPAGRKDGPAAYALARRRAQIRGAVAAIGSRSTGLVALVAADETGGADAAARLQSASEAASAAADELPDSVAATFASPQAGAPVDQAAEAVAALKVLLATEVASILSVTITLGDADGDS